MAEGGGSCPCNGAKKKSGVLKMFRLKKKKKPACTEQTACIKCLQKNVNLNEYTMDAFIEKERMMAAESNRKEPNYAQLLPHGKQTRLSEDDTMDPPLMNPLNTDRRLQSAGRKQLVSPVGAMGGLPEDPRLMELPCKYHPQNCICAPCKKKRYDDSLIAMDAQVILQNSLLSDTAGLVCVIL